jgi:WD40 repeat protein
MDTHGKRIISGYGKTIKIWNNEGEMLTEKTIDNIGKDNTIICISANSDANIIATGINKYVFIYNVKNDSILKLEEHTVQSWIKLHFLTKKNDGCI